MFLGTSLHLCFFIHFCRDHREVVCKDVLTCSACKKWSQFDEFTFQHRWYSIRWFNAPFTTMMWFEQFEVWPKSRGTRKHNGRSNTSSFIFNPIEKWSNLTNFQLGGSTINLVELCWFSIAVDGKKTLRMIETDSETPVYNVNIWICSGLTWFNPAKCFTLSFTQAFSRHFIVTSARHRWDMPGRITDLTYRVGSC